MDDTWDATQTAQLKLSDAFSTKKNMVNTHGGAILWEIKNPDEKHMLPPFFFNYCSHFPRSQIYSTLIKYIQENINIYGI